MRGILARLALCIVTGMTITLLLLLAAFGTTIASAIGKCPLWVPVLLIVVTLLIGALPLR